MLPIFFNSISFISSYFSRIFVGVPSAEIVGSIVGGGLLVGGAFLLVKQAITGDEGFKTIKQLALLSIIPIALVLLAQAINFSVIETALTNFFIVIRSLINVWDFWLDTPLLMSLLLATFSILVAYWTYKAYIFVVRFFNER